MRSSFSFAGLCRFYRKRGRLFGVLLLFLCSSAAFGAPSGDSEALYGEVERILNGHTAFSWGKDCIVWMVAYPEILVDPWVELKALEEGFSEEEKRAYKISFRRDLRLDDTEPVLVTLYVFGETPLDLTPFSEHVALRDSSNSLIPPLSYGDNLDGPLEGIVQGFVFFPPQEGVFSIQIEGIAPGGPRLFSFSGMGPRKEEEEDSEEEVLVVRLPENAASEKLQESPPPKLSPSPQPKPTPVPVPTEDPDKPPAYLVLPSKPSVEVPPEEPAKEESPSKENLLPLEEVPAPSPEEDMQAEISPDTPSREEELPFPINRVRRVEAFLQAWKEGNAEAMYAMLSEKSRHALSKEAFAETVLEDQFRFALKNPYTLKWDGENTVKVVAPQKMLVMRVLRSKVLHLVLEKGAWYVAW
ncbi:MAG TPA: hypothetical protein PLA80_02040 [Synergistaceae bacterium]|nr:hypothetical protein [Synergistaceae bacterium]